MAAASVASFRISAPVSVTQGVGFKVTVTALDSYGNIVTGYRGKVVMSSSDSKKGSSSYTFSSKDNGVATLSVTFTSLGAQSLTITDATNAAIFSTVMINVVAKK